MRRTLRYLGIDQYNNTHVLGRHPRKELLNKLCRKHADKMYVDGKDGSAVHVGYVIAGLWIHLYKVSELHDAQ